jgi:signal transduction histidine kinase
VAREANATKGRFLAAMSHELRTPLNGIIGLAELMHDGVVGVVTDEHKEYLGDILDSSRHLLRLVSDVLDLAKVESGKMEFRLEPVEIGPLLREVHDVLRIIADKKKIAFTLAISPELKTVVTDGARMKQVAYNYLSNAIKFTPEKGTIQVRATREGPASFRFEVEDTGPGIHASDIPLLFADFRQLEATPNQGTGLGLALTKRIVETLGGSVGVRSTPGSGSVFYAVLPGLAEPEIRPSFAREDVDFPGDGTAAVFSRIPIRPEVPQAS